VAKIYKEKYHPNSMFFSTLLGKKPSYTWWSIWSAKPLLQEGMVWRVGDGRSISIWGDKWLPTIPTHEVQSPNSTPDQTAKVCDLIDDSMNWWNIPLIEELFHPKEASTICGIAICQRTQSDKLVWAGNKQGELQ
jgi:hypothetical protein